MRSVRAKVHCYSATKKEEGQNQNIVLSAVTDESNKEWAAATPLLNLSMEIKNPDAQIFESGKRYYVDISEVPAPEPAPTAG